MKYVFDMAEVQRIAKYSAEQGADTFMLVKDQGTYLMPSKMAPEHKNPREAGLVIYAKGKDPSDPTLEFDDWWDGGDDYSETVPLKWLETAIENGSKTFGLNVSASRISLALPRRKSFIVTVMVPFDQAPKATQQRVAASAGKGATPVQCSVRFKCLSYSRVGAITDLIENYTGVMFLDPADAKIEAEILEAA